MKTRDYVLRRAGDVARSLISEGYLLVSKYTYGSRPEVHFTMRHKSNGNVIHVEVSATYVKLWKNQRLIKSEPLRTPVV